MRSAGEASAAPADLQQANHSAGCCGLTARDCAEGRAQVCLLSRLINCRYQFEFHRSNEISHVEEEQEDDDIQHTSRKFHPKSTSGPSQMWPPKLVNFSGKFLVLTNSRRCPARREMFIAKQIGAKVREI